MERTDHIEFIPSDGYYDILLIDLINSGYIDSNKKDLSEKQVII